MRAAVKYFYTAIGLFLAQVVLGAVTAHYAVEGQDFYGVPISDIIPYALTRTWHTQLGIFWIAPGEGAAQPGNRQHRNVHQRMAASLDALGHRPA